MTETPSSQPGVTTAVPQQRAGAGVGEGRFLALQLLFAIAEKSGDPNVLTGLDDYLPPTSQ